MLFEALTRSGCCPKSGFGLRIGHTGNQVGLAAYHYRRNMPFFQEPEPFYFVVLRHGFGEEKDGQVGFVQHLAALLHAQRAEVAFIVETRRVDQYARSQPVYLHRLEYGIGRRARRRGNDALCWPVRALISDDLPLLHRP